MEKELVKEKIREKVEAFSGKKILDDENLLDSSAEIPVNSWLYIFDELEKELESQAISNKNKTSD